MLFFEIIEIKIQHADQKKSHNFLIIDTQEQNGAFFARNSMHTHRTLVDVG